MHIRELTSVLMRGLHGIGQIDAYHGAGSKLGR